MNQNVDVGPDDSRLLLLLRREHIVVVGALAAIIALSWSYLVSLSGDMSGMDMGSAMAFAQMRSRDALDLWLLFIMWAVMMVGMMLPSAAPMILLYRQVARKAASRGRQLAPTAVFTLGYLLAWTLFSAVATLLQWLLEQLSLMSPAMVASSPWLGAGIVVAAGVYQLTPWKEACLEHCRNPVHLLSRHWRRGSAGALTMGAIHGGYCLGCCWALMTLLFVGGVMNLLWVALIAAFVLIEKLARFGRAAGRLSGVGLIAAGTAMLVAGLL